ncbi:hypothetical protein [Glycomyces sp. NPDC048151]
MEIFLGLVFLFIGACVMYWVVRLGVRDGIADARDAESQDDVGEDGDEKN